MSVVVTGATGALGSSLVKLLHKPIEVSRSQGTDLSKWSEVEKLIRQKPKTIYHTVAETDVEICETDTERSYSKTVITTRNVMRLAEETKAKVIYMSTDAVYPGDKGNYQETAPTRPVNTYGAHKLRAESYIRQSDLIVRGTFMCFTSSGKSTWYQKVLEKLLTEQKVYAFNDQVSSPIFVESMAESLYNLRTKAGIWNVGCVGGFSRYAIACAMAVESDCPVSLVVPVSVTNTPKPHHIPHDISLDTMKYVRGVGRPYSVASEIRKLLDSVYEDSTSVVISN